MKENFTWIPSRSRPRLFLNVALGLELDHFALEPHDLHRLRLHLPMAGQGVRRIVDLPLSFATLEWVDWFNNRRLLEPIGNIPPTEAETRYYAMFEEPAMAA